MAKVAINGMGRIGRAAFKIIEDTPGLELVAVNDLIDPDNIAYLLNFDSVYGLGRKQVIAENGNLGIGDKKIPIFSEKNPEQLPWKKYEVELVFECSGVFTKQPDLEKHIQAGAKHVILSAPSKSPETATIVHGTNKLDDEANIISCASCTTNCITPVMEVMDRYFSVLKAVMTTIHAYTSSQALVDGPASKYRRGRAAALNFVPTSTGAAKATTKVLTNLEGKFDGVAVRGPIPVGSLADIVIVTEKNVTVDEINNAFRTEADSERYKGIIGVADVPIVSSDIIGDPRASIVDLTMTQVVDGNLVKIMSWYDNEWGYANQMVKQGLSMVSE